MKRLSKLKILKNRKELIQEETYLLIRKTTINKRLREIRLSLRSWDNWLINTK